jgi:hypothetical protein
MANIARPTKIWDQTLNDWVFLAGVVDTTKSYTYTADQTFPGITATSLNGGPVIGRNYILNGGFDIWQRGTSITSSAGFLATTFLADRWSSYYYGGGNTANYTMSRQDQVPGAIPGYESQYFIRHAFPAGNATSYWEWQNRIEDVRTLAGQTVTFSFWAKSTGTTNPTIEIQQNFGTGGSTTNYAYLGAPTIGSTWNRYTWTTTLGSIAGKTIGAGSYLQFKLYFGPTAGTVTAFNLDIDNVQLEAGPVATPFNRQNASYQTELAACQRYFQTILNSSDAINTYENFGTGIVWAGNRVLYNRIIPITMRTSPSISLSTVGDITIENASAGAQATNYDFFDYSPRNFAGSFYCASSIFTIGQSARMRASATANARIYLSAEL